jgi:hypothetical protein
MCDFGDDPEEVRKLLVGRALAFKDHWNTSCNAAYMARQHIDYLVAKGELQHRVEIYGGDGDLLRDESACHSYPSAVSEYNDDLVSDLHLVRLLARGGPTGEGRSASAK